MKASKPRVSVLMCTNQIGRFYQQAIASILAQTLRSFELVVVANGPARMDVPEMRATLQCDERVRVVTSEWQHLTNNLNLGMEHCRAEYVARMDADDISFPRRLEAQVAFLDANPSIGVCGTHYALIDDEGRVVAERRPPCGDQQIRRAMFAANPICHPTVMYRRRIVLDAGGYMGGIYSEDYDLWVRLVTSGTIQFANLGEVMLGYRASPTGAARQASQAYASAAGTQMGAFVLSGDPRWLAGAILSSAKRMVRRKWGPS